MWVIQGGWEGLRERGCKRRWSPWAVAPHIQTNRCPCHEVLGPQIRVESLDSVDLLQLFMNRYRNALLFRVPSTSNFMGNFIGTLVTPGAC